MWYKCWKQYCITALLYSQGPESITEEKAERIGEPEGLGRISENAIIYHMPMPDKPLQHKHGHTAAMGICTTLSISTIIMDRGSMYEIMIGNGSQRRWCHFLEWSGHQETQRKEIRKQANNSNSTLLVFHMGSFQLSTFWQINNFKKIKIMG